MKEAIVRTEHCLASLIQPGGHILSKASARAIETALTLVLLRDTDFAPGMREPLLACCNAFLKEPVPEATGTALDIGHTFSRLLLHCATGHDPVDASQELSRAVDAFGHSSTSRKKMMFSILLAEAGVIPFSSLSYRPQDFQFSVSQHWARLMMTSTKLIYGAGRGNDDFITLADIAFLETSQCINGGWENHIMLTVVALIALKHTRPESPYLHKGICFLEDQVTPDGGIPFLPDLNIWLTAITGTLFKQRNVLPEARAQMAQYIASAQGSRGGWGFSEEVREQDVDDTAICLWFLQAQDPDRQHYATQMKAAEDFLLSFQNEDGGFPTYVHRAPSEVEVTAHVVTALAQSGRFPEVVKRGSNWLLHQQNADGSFPFEWTLSSHFTGSQVFYALKQSLPGVVFADQMTLARTYTLKSQNPDGGWGQFPGMHSTPLSTCYALIGLSQYHGQGVDEAIRKGQTYLLGHQSPNGAFSSPPDALGPRPLVYEVKLFATVYAYWALSLTLPLNNPGG